MYANTRAKCQSNSISQIKELISNSGLGETNKAHHESWMASTLQQPLHQAHQKMQSMPEMLQKELNTTFSAGAIAPLETSVLSGEQSLQAHNPYQSNKENQQDNKIDLKEKEETRQRATPLPKP